ncbi:MAG: membrane protein insertase YidC, partial [Bacteroidales bacterium]|nr:membrane protein insertase YidC [Bacteroidales bacterium]
AYTAAVGKFGSSALGENQDVVLENDKVIITIASKGAMIKSVQLKGFKTNSGDSLFLMKNDPQNEMTLDFFAGNNAVSTKNLYFAYTGASKLSATEGNPAKAVFRANVDSNSWLEFNYELRDGFLLDYNIVLHNLDNIVNRNTSTLDLSWNQFLPILETGNMWEKRNSDLCFKYADDDAESLGGTVGGWFSGGSSDAKDEILSTPTKWIAYKGQFFSSICIARTTFQSAEVAMQPIEANGNLKFMSSTIHVPANVSEHQMVWYFGPNQYKVLDDIELEEGDKLDLGDLVPLGGWFLGTINRYLIIPFFNFLGTLFDSYGIIILILTITVKAVLFPLTYKSYKSSAAMRVLKPQMDEINKKYPRQEDAMKKQQAVMELYQKAGISPIGGCLPMLLQMPILIALFRFFPASIELRQQSFLWASDLSSFDSVLDLPFSIPFYGDHVSLFALLMSIAMIVQTKITSGQMDTGAMPGMKLMLYFMPVMMLFWFNDYASGLTYYYLLSNIIAILQIVLVRNNIDEKAILDKLNAKVAKNSGKKKSGWLARLEEAQRRQMEMMKEQEKKKKKK